MITMNPLFVDYLTWLLSQLGITDRRLFSIENLQIFYSSFTAASVDPVHNYEWYEHVGDAVHWDWMCGTIYARFPHLRCKEGVKIVALMRIRYTARDEMAQIAVKWKMWPHVRALAADRERSKDKLCEDVLEAFLGALKIVGEAIAPLYGTKLAFTACDALYRDHSYETCYELLIDAKTQLKEVCDKYKNVTVKYNKRVGADNMYSVNLTLTTGSRDICLAAAEPYPRAIQGEQSAARAALALLEKKGMSRACRKQVVALSPREKEPTPRVRASSRLIQRRVKSIPRSRPY